MMIGTKKINECVKKIQYNTQTHKDFMVTINVTVKQKNVVKRTVKGRSELRLELLA